MRTAIVTDSNSGITPDEASANGIYVVPMPFYINDELFFENVTMSQEQFYNYLAEGADVHTSQPSPADVTDLWDSLLKEYDEIIYIPMSSGLSSSYATAAMLSKEDEYDGKVFVVDNQRISVTQQQSVYEAKRLADAGYDARTIHDILIKTKFDSSIYITVDTMEYLKKGGRVTAAAAGIATILNIKPVLQIQGEKLDQFTKVRGMKSAKKEMIAAMKKDMETRFADFESKGLMTVHVAYTLNKEQAIEFEQEVRAAFPESDFIYFHRSPLSLSVSCHIGPGSLAIACARTIIPEDCESI